jgi:hypothetical protein
MATPNRNRLYLERLRRTRPQLFAKLVQLAAGNASRLSSEEKEDLSEQGAIEGDGTINARQAALVLEVSDDE